MISNRTRRTLLSAVCFGIWMPTLAFLPQLIGTRRDPGRSLHYSQQNTNPDQPPNTVAPRRRYQKRVSNIRRKSFSRMLPRLKKFYDIHGHTEVTTQHGDPELYDWVKTLRYNYVWQIRKMPDPTGRRKRLSEIKIQQLADLNFKWETSRDWKRWPAMLDRLREYKTKHGTTHVDPVIDLDLYDWTRNLRKNYLHQAWNQTSSSNLPQLAKSKLEALNDIGFDWGHSRRRRYLRWDDMYPRLKAYQETHGHTIVKKEDDNELYRWTKTIIANYRGQLANRTSVENAQGFGRGPYLSPKKLQQLDELGFDWERRSTMWERRYEELSLFRKKYGHCHVTSLQNPQLSTFVQNQRQQYRQYLAGNATSMTPYRIEALQKIDFEWARSHNKLWEERREELKVYRDKTGNTNVPQNYAENYALGQWCMNQRTKHRQRQSGQRNGMTRRRISKLEEMGFQWQDPRWMTMFSRLELYEEEHGHTKILPSDKENSDLRQWVNEQRYFYRTGDASRLSEERIAKLESLSTFEWRRQLGSGPSADDWSQLFVAIREKGIAPGAKVKQHWFDGVNPFEQKVKTEWTEQELVALFNEEDDGEEEDEYWEDENSTFLRA